MLDVMLLELKGKKNVQTYWLKNLPLVNSSQLYATSEIWFNLVQGVEVFILSNAGW